MTSADIPAIDAFVFDAYGTLFDVRSVSALAETLARGRGDALAQLWRTKQLEYTWWSALMSRTGRRRDDFAELTARALDYALEALAIPMDVRQRTLLASAYLALAPFADVPAALDALAPRPRWILSNGTRAMLDPLVRASGLAPHFDGVISVDEADAYKPDPRVYRLAADRLRMAPTRIGFVSSNAWDAAGAKAFGFTVFWINRNGAPAERHAPPPDYIIATLEELPALVA
jgi:2-haloacid dehalogenase